jgi:hypothetical protein
MDVSMSFTATVWKIHLRDCLCGLVVRLPGCRSRFSEYQWVWNWVHSTLVRINEELLDRKVTAPV